MTQYSIPTLIGVPHELFTHKLPGFYNGELSNPYGSSRSFDQEVQLGYDDCGADLSHRKERIYLDT